MKNIAWDDKITWYFYNDAKVYKKSDMYFEKEAYELKKVGIDIVLLYHMHARFNFYPYWDRILHTLSLLARSFQKYGIKTVEHHSCSLTCIPLSEAEWEQKKASILHEIIEADAQADWGLIKPWITKKAVIDNVDVTSMMQIHGGTHELSPTQYDTRIMCYNNEDFRRIYFSHLEDIYQTGVHGIMTDDVQFFANGHACACDTCRSKFTEQTGYTLPTDTEKWNEDFFGDFENPVYMAFDRFRRSSAIAFQRAVTAHYESLGKRMLRPNYISDEVRTNYSAYPFSNCADLWDVMFQENVIHSIIRYSWPFYAVEAVHRYAFASANDIPSMSMFYAKSISDLLFSFGFCMSLGQMFNPAFNRTQDMVQTERILRSFEQKYPNLLYAQQKRSDIAFMFSMKTRDCVKNASSGCMQSLIVWLQTAFMKKRMPDFVLESMSLEKWSTYPVICFAHVFMMSDEELRRIGQYVASGKTALIIGACGIKTPDGTDRSAERIKRLMGVKTLIRRIQPITCSASLEGRTLEPMVFDTAYEHAEPIYTNKDRVLIAKEQLGGGELIYIGADTNRLEALSMVHDLKKAHVNKRIENMNKLMQTVGLLLQAFVKNTHVEPVKEDVLIGSMQSKDNLHTMVHILNTRQTLDLDPESGPDGESEPPFYTKKRAEGNREYTLSFACVRKPKKVRLLSPEWGLMNDSFEKKADYTWKNGMAHVTIKQATFRGYLLVDAVHEKAAVK